MRNTVPIREVLLNIGVHRIIVRYFDLSMGYAAIEVTVFFVGSTVFWIFHAITQWDSQAGR